MSECILGRGVLSWDSLERVTDRYGTVRLFRHHRRHAPPVELASGHEGASGVLLARVIEARPSRHYGDLHRKIFPAMPAVGDDVILGRGELARHCEQSLYVVGLIPADGREDDWLDPVQLFRAIDQTVDLVFQPTGLVGYPPRTIPALVLGSLKSIVLVETQYEIRRPGMN